MRKSKQNRKKKTLGTNLKTSPLKTYKKQIKRMKNRLKDGIAEGIVTSIWKKRLEGAELHLKNYDREQEQKKADAMKNAHLKTRLV